MKKLNIYLDTSVLNFLFADDAPQLKNITIEFLTSMLRTTFLILIYLRLLLKKY